MESRKIISFGNSSYVVSLPKDWVKENKLKKGDTIHIDEKSDELTLYPGNTGEKRIEPKTIIIESENKDHKMIQTEIISAYLNNYDVIEVKGKLTKDKAVQVKAILRNLSGIEIIKQDATKIVAKDLLNINEISIETMIRRMDNIVRSMLLDSIKSIHEDLYEEIYERDQDVNRLVFLAYRVLRAAIIDSKIAKNMQKANIELLFSQVLIEKLEKVADKTKRVARFLKQSNLTDAEKKELEEIYIQIKDCFFEVMKAYYKKDLDLAFKIENAGTERINKLNEFIKERQNAPAHIVVEQMKSMVISIKNIARAVIGMEKNVW
ncbi:MAG: phosphate uptake regulator PhoU [Nanoarchaeota archaeon]|nr:phosphate uptake regulator PhoU [Nanoarchaeota archaeon]